MGPRAPALPALPPSHPSPDSQEVMGTPPDRTPRPRTRSRTPKGKMQAQDGGGGRSFQAREQCVCVGGSATWGSQQLRAACTPNLGSISLCPADVLVCGLPSPPPAPASKHYSLFYPHLNPLLISGKKSQDPRGAGAAYASGRCLGEGGFCVLGASWGVRFVLSRSSGFSQSLLGQRLQGGQGSGLWGCEEGV